jgi:hypothetical protein
VCDAEYPERGRCRASDPHAIHVAGYGLNLVTWPNESFVPAPRTLAKGELARWANRLRREEQTPEAS